MLNLLKKNWLLFLILAISAFFRLYRIGDYMEFLGDQGRDVLIVRDFLKNGNLFFIGPQTSIGNMYLGPYYYYLIAPSLLLANYNPIGPAVFIALIGVVTVYLIYHFCHSLFNRRLALIAAFLYAVSPVVIKYSNFSWNPNIMPFFSLLLVYSLYLSLRDRRYPLLIVSSLSFIMCFNSHFIALALLPFVGIYWLYHLIILVRAKSTSLRPFIFYTLIALALFIISLAPLVVFDVKHHGQNINALIQFFTYRETTINLKPYKTVFSILPLSVQYLSRILSNGNSIYGIILTILFCLTSIHYLFIKKDSKYLYIFLWLFVGLACLGLYKQHVYDHYFGIVFPVPFIVLAYIINSTFSLNRLLPLLLTVLFSIPMLNINPLQKQPLSQLKHAQAIALAISQNLSDSDGKYNISLLASYNDFRAQAPRYFLVNNYPSANLLSVEEYPQVDTLFVVVDDPSKWPNNYQSDIWEIKASGATQLTQVISVQENLKIYKLKK